MAVSNTMLLVVAVVGFFLISGIFYTGFSYMQDTLSSSTTGLAKYIKHRTNYANYDIDLIATRSDQGEWSKNFRDIVGRTNEIMCDLSYCYSINQDSKVLKLTKEFGQNIWLAEYGEIPNIYESGPHEKSHLTGISCYRKQCDLSAYKKIGRIKEDGNVLLGENNGNVQKLISRPEVPTGLLIHQGDQNYITSLWCDDKLDGFCYAGGNFQVVRYSKGFSSEGDDAGGIVPGVQTFRIPMMTPGNSDAISEGCRNDPTTCNMVDVDQWVIQYVYDIECDDNYCYMIVNNHIYHTWNNGPEESHFIKVNKNDFSLVYHKKLCDYIPDPVSSDDNENQGVCADLDYADGVSDRTVATDMSCVFSKDSCYISMSVYYENEDIFEGEPGDRDMSYIIAAEDVSSNNPYLASSKIDISIRAWNAGPSNDGHYAESESLRYPREEVGGEMRRLGIQRISCDKSYCYCTMWNGNICKMNQDNSLDVKIKDWEELGETSAIWCDDQPSEGFCFAGDNEGRFIKFRKGSI